MTTKGPGGREKGGEREKGGGEKETEKRREGGGNVTRGDGGRKKRGQDMVGRTATEIVEVDIVEREKKQGWGIDAGWRQVKDFMYCCT